MGKKNKEIKKNNLQMWTVLKQRVKLCEGQQINFTFLRTSSDQLSVAAWNAVLRRTVRL